MSDLFDYPFYTKEFDQEMLDFISGKGISVGGDNEWSTGHENLYYGTGVNDFWTDNDSDCRSYTYRTKQEFKKLIGMVDSQPETYTKLELAYIPELEDRVEYLEALCSEYVSHIEQLRGITIQPEGFKPISEMTIKDWQQALAEGWQFETADRGEVTVNYLAEDDTNHEVRLCDGEESWWVALDGTDHDREGWTVIERIK